MLSFHGSQNCSQQWYNVFSWRHSIDALLNQKDNFSTKNVIHVIHPYSDLYYLEHASVFVTACLKGQTSGIAEFDRPLWSTLYFTGKVSSPISLPEILHLPLARAQPFANLYITASQTRPKPAAAALDHTSLFTYNIAVYCTMILVASTITWNLSKLEHSASLSSAWNTFRSIDAPPSSLRHFDFERSARSVCSRSLTFQF